MFRNRHAARRLMGVAFLGMALAMLICGLTLLRGRLPAIGFLLYWWFCFLFTLGAMAVALADLRAVRRAHRDEARELIERSLEELPKPRRPSRNGGNGPGENS